MALGRQPCGAMSPPCGTRNDGRGPTRQALSVSSVSRLRHFPMNRRNSCGSIGVQLPTFTATKCRPELNRRGYPQTCGRSWLWRRRGSGCAVRPNASRPRGLGTECRLQRRNPAGASGGDSSETGLSGRLGPPAAPPSNVTVRMVDRFWPLVRSFHPWAPHTSTST